MQRRKRKCEALGVGRAALLQHPLGKGARGFDVGHVVERGEGVQRRVRAADFTAQFCRLATSKNIVGPTMRRQKM